MDGVVRLWDTATGEMIRELQLHKREVAGHRVNAGRFASRDGQRRLPL
jgi:hypothetical protein